jgi:hypothetical protein
MAPYFDARDQRLDRGARRLACLVQLDAARRSRDRRRRHVATELEVLARRISAARPMDA